MAKRFDWREVLLRVLNKKIVEPPGRLPGSRCKICLSTGSFRDERVMFGLFWMSSGLRESVRLSGAAR